MSNKILCLVSATLTVFLLSIPLHAQTTGGSQQQTSTPDKGPVIKGKAPVNKETLKVSLPKPYETTLSNGLKVIIYENHKLPTFTMRMVILAGGQQDSDTAIGTASAVADLLREGTKTRTSKQIAEEVDKLGASVSASSDLTSQTSEITASGLKGNFDSVLNIFTDLIMNPTFPTDELEKYKARYLNQMRMQRSQPAFLATEMLMKSLYGNHPATRTSVPADHMKSFSRELLEKFHANYYKPNNAILAIVGDVNRTGVIETIEKTFASWKPTEISKTKIAEVIETSPAKISLIDRPNSIQTSIQIGALSITRNDPDYFHLQVMNQILGGGPGTRLYQNLRESKGYTYSVRSFVSSRNYRGVFAVNTEVRQNVTRGAMDELIFELKRIRDEQIPDDEFDNAKRTIVGSWALQLEYPSTVIQNAITSKLYNLPSDYWDTYTQKIAAVTKEDVMRVAKKYIDLNKLQIVAVGEAAKITDALKPFGKIEIFDINGKPVTPATP